MRLDPLKYLLGFVGQYPVNQDVTVGLCLDSDYDYLVYRSDQPEYASQHAWIMSPEWKLNQNLFARPKQRNTGNANRRYLSDSILQWSGQDLPQHLALRPEIYWDGDGRLTGNRQLIKSVTATVAYEVSLNSASLILRSAYRYEESTGSQAGFFKVQNTNLDLIAGQHAIFFSCLCNFDQSL